MSELDSSPVPAPFDQLPSDELGGDEVAAGARNGLAMKAGLVVLFLVCVGFGQGIAITWLFDDEPQHLTPPAAQAEKSSPPEAHEPIPAPAAAPPKVKIRMPEIDVPEPPRRDPHLLDIAKERFEIGDVEGARRIAAAYLLRVDGMTHADVVRAPAAYAILGDVLRRDYERSLDREDD